VATFTPLDPAKLPGPASLREARQQALARFELGPLPTGTEDIWKYSRIAELDPGAFRAARPQAPTGIPPAVGTVLDLIGERAAFALTIDGATASIDVEHDAAAAGLRLHVVKEGDGIGWFTGAATPWDAFAELNTGQAPSPVVIAVPDNTIVRAPVVICHWTATDGAVTFPRSMIRIGTNASVTVVEYFLSADVSAWVDPVTEVRIGDGGHGSHLVVQDLGQRIWQTAFVGSEVGRDASLTSFAVALGGEYARVRTDSRIVGTGGRADLLALYCGDGHQMHDFRTLQLHEGAKSTSDLVFKGAVQDEATSAYSGLIRVARGAAGTKAFQTNRNLTLSDSGLATYSVPELDIEENDVSCSHASATGPIDEDQRFYLESRGVPTEIADQLIVLGFFDDLLSRLPVPALRPHLSDVIASKLGIRGG
jgi:Fe-S cluster assembly protein SufD